MSDKSAEANVRLDGGPSGTRRVYEQAEVDALIAGAYLAAATKVAHTTYPKWKDGIDIDVCTADCPHCAITKLSPDAARLALEREKQVVIAAVKQACFNIALDYLKLDETTPIEEGCLEFRKKYGVVEIHEAIDALTISPDAERVAPLVEALEGLLKFCDVDSNNETEWEQAVTKARSAVERSRGGNDGNG